MMSGGLPETPYLSECFIYDPETGVLTWRSRPISHFAALRSARSWNARYANTPAGGAGKRYLYVRLMGHNHYVHRIIWKMITGADPAARIDHKDMVETNNRWANLRSATHAQNLHNRDASIASKSGIKGVYWHRHAGKWAATIAVKSSNKHLGLFATKEDAANAYRVAAIAFHGEFARWKEPSLIEKARNDGQ